MTDSDYTPPAAVLDAILAGAKLRIANDLNLLVSHKLLTGEEGTRIAEVLADAQTRREEALLPRGPLVDPDTLRLASIECTLGPDLCAKCWDAALAAEAYARPTGAVAGTYRDEQRGSDGVLVTHSGTWNRVDDVVSFEGPVDGPSSLDFVACGWCNEWPDDGEGEHALGPLFPTEGRPRHKRCIGMSEDDEG